MATRATRNVERKKKALLKWLYETRGNISEACSACGIGRTMFYEYMKEDPEFKKAVDEVKDYKIDYVESRLMNRIDSNDTTAIIFFLKTQAKSRGYIETIQNEVTGRDGAPVEVKQIIKVGDKEIEF